MVASLLLVLTVVPTYAMPNGLRWAYAEALQGRSATDAQAVAASNENEEKDRENREDHGNNANDNNGNGNDDNYNDNNSNGNNGHDDNEDNGGGSPRSGIWVDCCSLYFLPQLSPNSHR